jgi:membrane-bound metal-dependent hydrolase YbcI (DUF457 family)
MPNYPTHARWGRVGAAVVGVAVAGAVYTLVGGLVLVAVGALGAAVTTFVGSIYPDIDHHTSVPRQKAVRGFQLLAALGVAGLAAANWEGALAVGESTAAAAGASVPPVAPAAGLVVVGAVVGTALVNPVVGLVTVRHRGWTHSLPINFVLVAALAGGVWVATGALTRPARVVAVVVTASFYLGTLVHLGLDGEIP